MTIMLAMMFAGTVGFAIAAGFNNHSYNKGHKDGYHKGMEDGYELGHKEGSEDAKHSTRIYPFPKKEDTL